MSFLLWEVQVAYRKSNQINTAVLLSPALFEEISALAAHEMVSRSDIIRRWLMIGRAAEAERVAQAVEARREVA